MSNTIYAAAVELGIDAETESRFLAIAKEMCDESSLPEDWVMYYDDNTKRSFYNNGKTGESIWQHPNLEYFKCRVYMERTGNLLLRQNESSRPPTQDEIGAMADYFEVDVGEPPGVLAVIRMAINAPLPSEWIELDSGGDEVVFQNKTTGEVRDEHPLDPYFRELIRKARTAEGAGASARDVNAEDVGDGAQTKGGDEGSQQDAGKDANPDMKRQLKDQLFGSPAIEKIRQQVEKEVRKEIADRGIAINAGSSGGLARGEADAQSDAGFAQVLNVEEDKGAHASEDGIPMRSSESIHADDEATSVNADQPADHKAKEAMKVKSMIHARRDEKIQVIIRARPLERRALSAWAINNKDGVISLKDNVRLKHAKHFYGEVQHRQSSKENKGIVAYAFDKVFGEADHTADVYNQSVKAVVQSALEGINGTVFAYGQTGSGKTYTILGTQDNPGVLMLAINDIFRQVSAASASNDYTLKVGMLEIYNEELRDLLVPPINRWHAGERLQIKEHPILGVKVNGLQEEIVTDKQRVKTLIAKGLHRRQTAATKLNTESSRSHTIFRMTIETKPKAARGQKGKPGSVRVSTLNFVDLAGSERLAKSGNVGVRAQESTQINLSLMQLGNVISKLSGGKEGEFIPYRNSNLTRILQPSLGGNARTVIVATMSVASLHAEETSHTLRFAARAKTVINHVLVNEVISDNALVKQYKQEIQALQQQLRTNEEKGKEAEFVLQLQTRIAELDRENINLSDKLEAMRAKGISDSPPPSPLNLDLPSVLPDKKYTGPALNVEKALLSIARAAGVGRSGGGGREQKPEDILYAVRVMRAERDELRRLVKAKDKFREEIGMRLENENMLREERGIIEDACNTLEDLIGGKGQAESLADRLKLAVDSSVIMSAELAALERHRKELITLTREHEKAVLQATAKLEKMAEAEQEIQTQKHEIVQLKEKVHVALKQRDDYAKKLDIDPATLDHSQGRALPGGAAMNYANTLEAHLKKEKDKTKKLEMDVQLYRRRIATIIGVRDETEISTKGSERVGGAAIIAAREAKEKLAKAEKVVAILEGEKTELIEQVKKFQEMIPEDYLGRAVAQENGHEAEDKGDDSYDQMKTKVYALSMEVTNLNKERNQLISYLQAISTKYELPNIPFEPKQLSTMQSRTHPQALKDNRNTRNMQTMMNGNGEGATGIQYDLHMIQEDTNWKAKKKKRREWISPRDNQDNIQADVIKLRKRLVEVERARQEAAARLGAQNRTIKMQKQASEKYSGQIVMLTNELESARHELQTAIGQMKYEKKSRKMIEHRARELEIENEDLRQHFEMHM